MNVIRFIYSHRGPVNFARRAFQVVSRFGPGPGRMGRRFDRFLDLLDRFDCRPTFPMTALPMSRHPWFAKHLLERGVELAVHSYSHVDLTSLGREGQKEQMEKAVATFRRLGVPFSGFRAPYLHWNDDTMDLVDAYRFRYSSNQAVLWKVLDEAFLTGERADGWRKGVAFYAPADAAEFPSLPFFRKGFVEIPVSLPDDEILLDRMYVRDPDVLSETWERMAERIHARGELFTVQLHPERIGFFTEPLENLLLASRTRKPGVWMTTLDEIADWWREKSSMHASFTVVPGGVRARLECPRRAAVYLRMDGTERKIDPGEILVPVKKRPCVGVDPESESSAVEQLQQRGYIIEIGESPEDFAIHLGRLDSGALPRVIAELERLDAFPGPLVRFGTWPHGHRSALAVTGDIDALTVWDFVHRMRGA